MIVLNGGSSAGKSGIARCLQALLPEPWLVTGVDALIESMPAALRESDGGLAITADGGVSVGEVFLELERAWMQGVAATVGAGARVVIDDVFLDGPVSQGNWRRALDGRNVLWVGVHCDAAVAADREVARGDRVAGMAAAQAELVHRGVVYDLDVDTTTATPMDCARLIAARAGGPGVGRRSSAV
ncbi:chloramphenicol phosphotransferase CPT [Streptomyces piniterrae]|uniref:Chloramphenicol phosphotransferase CPT n=1 Tax=Streptomyces piniterrae TaxID=2571125 RepID=A0A4U0NSP0_9ACTN|nr:chloramphenicol phosphotransferase CPT [Streptomyces piniterrae]